MNREKADMIGDNWLNGNGDFKKNIKGLSKKDLVEWIHYMCVELNNSLNDVLYAVRRCLR